MVLQVQGSALSDLPVLVVEDSDSKWEQVKRLFDRYEYFGVSLRRATTVIDAEDEVASVSWALVVLDVSMDIASSATGPKKGGHDPLGGLRVAKKMFLLGKEAPTIILTAFDSFPTSETGRRLAESLGLEDVQAQASEILGSAFVGCVRYGDEGWAEKLAELAGRVLGK